MSTMAMTTHATTPCVMQLSTNETSKTNFMPSSPAFESAVTAYALRVLRINSPPEACYDSSVASYVISTLQSAFTDSTNWSQTINNDASFSLKSLDEYQSLMELLEEHCNITSTVAYNALESIAKAVRTGVFDSDTDLTSQNKIGTTIGQHGIGGMINLGGSHVGSQLGRYRSRSLGYESDNGCEDVEAINLLGDMLSRSSMSKSNSLLYPEMRVTGGDDAVGIIDEEKEPSFFLEKDSFLRTLQQEGQSSKHSTPMTSEETSIAEDWNTVERNPSAMNTQSLTPLKPDMLIPVGLLGGIDDPSKPGIQSGDEKTDMISHEIYPSIQIANEASSKDSKPVPNDIFTFKNSGKNCKNSTSNALPMEASTASRPIPVPTTRGKKKSKSKSKDLAAALFCSSRPRSNSLQEKSPKLKPVLSPPVPYFGMSSINQEQALFQQQVDSTIQWLMAMNYDVCEEAAYEAALVSNADVNVAQHVIDGALEAPPICRHMLNDGCYRSDCQFSHDVDGHTCSFWLRGRCGKGDSCRFLHGFSQKLLEGMTCNFIPEQNQSESPKNAAHFQSHGMNKHDSKPIPIKTANLVQHNMKTASSYSNQGSRTPNTFQSSPPRGSGSDVSSFARIASKGYKEKSSFYSSMNRVSDEVNHDKTNLKTVRIPQNLWNSFQNRPSVAFHIDDPIERYKEVSSSLNRDDLVDLHFQSVKTFSFVLSKFLPEKLRDYSEVWVVMGTGHHVNQNSHQRGGGILENAVTEWLTMNGYNFMKGKDKNGYGGAVLVKR